MPASRASRAPKINPRRYSRAEILKPVEVRSAAAQKVVSRTLLRCSRALYTIEVVLYAIGNQDEVDQVANVIGDMLDTAHDEMSARIAETDQMIADAALDSNIEFTAPMRITFHITSGHLGRYADLILRLDQLVYNIELLRLNGAIGSRKATNLSYDARNDLLQLGLELSKLEGAARAAAIKKGGASVVEQAEGEAVNVVTGDGDAVEWLKEAEEAETDLRSARNALKAVG
jgi:hypothetical protein